MNEPQSSPPTPRPCSTPVLSDVEGPHSAPVAWLKTCPEPAEGYDPGIDPPATVEAQPVETGPRAPEEQRRHDIDGFLAAYEHIAPEAERRDGWTPFLRKLFLQTIAETGKVTLACAYTGMSRSSAYALQARDRVFAVGWDAAAYFARNPLADDIYEKGVEGITETVTRSDGVTVTRHRYDSRLSIAALNRLDRRCDRAEESGSVHLAAVRNWDEYLRLVGNGDDQAAEALLDTPQQRPTCPLPERANPIPAPSPPGCDPWDKVWKLGTEGMRATAREHGLADGTWMTSFPPPPGFDGYQNCRWDGFAYYERECTAEEAELIDAGLAAEEAEEYAEITGDAEAERDSFFGKLRTKLPDRQDAGSEPHRGHPAAGGVS
jgi:hypothetical protein